MHIIFVKLGNLHNSAAKLLQIFHICKHSGIFFEKKAIYREFVRTERLSGACSRIVILWPDKQGHQSRFLRKCTKNALFQALYLHICKKSSNFARDFENNQ